MSVEEGNSSAEMQLISANTDQANWPLILLDLRLFQLTNFSTYYCSVHCHMKEYIVMIIGDLIVGAILKLAEHFAKKFDLPKRFKNRYNKTLRKETNKM